MKDYLSNPKEGLPLKNSKGYEIARIRGDELVKYVYGSRHMLQSPRGWSIDVTCLKQALAAGVKNVVIIDLETNRVYTAPLASFWGEGTFIDRGYGAQFCLTLEYWTITDL